MKKQCIITDFISFDDVKDGELIIFEGSPNKVYLKLSGQYYEFDLRKPTNTGDLNHLKINAIFSPKDGRARVRKGK